MMTFSILQHLLGTRRGGDIERQALVWGPYAEAALCLARRDYTGFWAALPPDTRTGLLLFLEHGAQ